MAVSASETAVSPKHSLLRLRVSADADAQSLARVLEWFANLDVTPRRVRVEWGTNSVIHIEVDVAGLSEETMTLIAAKVDQATSVLNAYWHHL
jgi:hypothetical protein